MKNEKPSVAGIHAPTPRLTLWAPTLVAAILLVIYLAIWATIFLIRYALGY